MARMTLSDGREVPLVKPHLGDQMDLERQMRASRPKYGTADFKEDMKLSGFQTAFSLFASFNRAGIRTTIQEVLELDLDVLSNMVELDPGDAPSEDDAEPGDEGEQRTDPQLAQTGDADAEQ